MSDEDMLEDILGAEKANMHNVEWCDVCVALGKMSDAGKAGVERALRGTIGMQKLADILTKNGYPTGRRAVMNHRREGHTS